MHEVDDDVQVGIAKYQNNTRHPVFELLRQSRQNGGKARRQRLGTRRGSIHVRHDEARRVCVECATGPPCRRRYAPSKNVGHLWSEDGTFGENRASFTAPLRLPMRKRIGIRRTLKL